jgi:nondiscriminating glutamyl-tRNA synthetase
MSNIRVRFAPSPTGFVHLGSLRTALYNYLFARHHNGTFILRIEDTDQARYTEGAVENLLTTLDWAGLEYDEGPEKDGSYGPYYQSQRRGIYQKYIDQLLADGNAYRCFCSEERLLQLREEQTARKETPKYDELCRSLSDQESKSRADGESHVIRLKIPESGETIVNDIIRGEVSFQNELIDDQVLLKSDGFPTYHLANVVDDHLMQISHVIRGEEWLLSMPKHILLYKYLGWETPQFAHLPLLLNEDRSKLSKRQGDVAVEDYRKKGYLPQALANFVAMLGWNRGDDQEIFSMQELIESFSLERVNKAGAIFNREKLDWMNGVYLRQISEDEYLDYAISALKEAGLDSGDDVKNQLIVKAIRNSLSHLDEIETKTALFYNEQITEYDDEARQWLIKDDSKKIFAAMIDKIEQLPDIDLNSFKSVIAAVQNETGIKGKDLWMPVRAAMTGLTEGPELPLVIDILGKDKMIKFLNQAMELK